jgi:hypothetical protein
VSNDYSGDSSPSRRVIHKKNPAAPARAVYDGRERLGEISQQGEEFVARDRLGQSLGKFDTAAEAIEAVAAAAQAVR